ncbi:hypothetical protein H257_16195 [Aphanomyces astaci]|uniref:Uncharacterized protein n=1 Tax=Aphanomyces astaci TaxID=112090 RepID=W4FL56_APHAT|nr:hypothetical protein H257_16195 [Aphanomyces astaci]ETV67596.1 hypothetical protein H257_16195 [Aphanomyces astaci]|eukprot:XP_009842853.1 hypothetical protein H257_16195 [Aphanomyces astaci]
MGKAMQKQLAWSTDMDLALLREAIASSLSTLFECEIPYRSARDHYESMVEAFKSTDKAQRLWGTGSDEEVTEQVQLLQDLVDRRAATDEAKKSKKDKEQKKRDSLESTGSQLCLEAEQRVVKRQRSVSSVTTKKEDPDANGASGVRKGGAEAPFGSNGREHKAKRPT